MTSGAASGAAMLVRSLEVEGVDYLFCIPGAKVDKVLDCLIGTAIKVVVCRHEQNAALIAQGIGRMTGRAGVCLVTSGPGCTNLTTGLATANYEGDAVVALGGAVPLADRLKLAHQSLDTVSLFRPVTKFAAEITSGHGIPEVVAAAFRAAECGRPGAAFVALPKDVMEGPAPSEHPGPAPRPHLGCPDPAAIAEAAGRINRARLPVLCLGMQANVPRVAAAVRALLHKTLLPVVCTYQGAGVVPRDLLSCFAGRVGLTNNQPGDRLLDAADVVVTIGFDPIEYDPFLWNHGKKRTIIHIDSTPAEMDVDYWPAVELIGDIGAIVAALAGQLAPQGALKEIAELGAAARALDELKRHGAVLDGSPVHPLRLIYELQEMLPDDATVLCDVGSLYMWMSRYFFSFQPRHFLTSNGQQTLGVALPWAIAASLVRPGKPILSMSGDGGFLFSAQELETAVRLKSNFVHLVWTDGFYDMVKIQQDPKYGRHTAVELGPVDVVKYAEAFGATGMRIYCPAEIASTLRKAFETSGPVLIDVPVDYRDNPKLFETVQAAAVH
jgi:acetolactate synthase I/II/III large subunit